MRFHWALLTTLAVHTVHCRALPVVGESDEVAKSVELTTENTVDLSAEIADDIDDVILPIVTVPILPPVSLVVENEIWQYRYPPFEDIVQSDEEVATRGRTPKGGSLAGLPDYVIGILNPSELIENIFRPVSDFLNGGIHFPRNVDDDSDVFNRFNARDDRWVWKG